MRMREKLTQEEKFALALELLKRERTLDEIRVHYRVSHTTAYKIRNAFLEGGRAALSRERDHKFVNTLEARVSALETLVGDTLRAAMARGRAPSIAAGNGNGASAAPRRAAKSS